MFIRKHSYCQLLPTSARQGTSRPLSACRMAELAKMKNAAFSLLRNLRHGLHSARKKRQPVLDHTLLSLRALPD